MINRMMKRIVIVLAILASLAFAPSVLRADGGTPNPCCYHKDMCECCPNGGGVCPLIRYSHNVAPTDKDRYSTFSLK